MAPLEKPAAITAAGDSINTILELERRDREELDAAHRILHAIGAFFGTIYFIGVQIVVVGVWILINSTAALHFLAIDPFPFPLLATFLSLESVLLTSCVLIRQEGMARTSERRDNLELQINLLAEREATRSLDILHRLARHLKVPGAGEPESAELAKETPVDEIARDLRNREKQAEENR